MSLGPLILSVGEQYRKVKKDTRDDWADSCQYADIQDAEMDLRLSYCVGTVADQYLVLVIMCENDRQEPRGGNILWRLQDATPLLVQYPPHELR